MIRAGVVLAVAYATAWGATATWGVHRIRAAEIEGWQSVPVDVPEDVPVVEGALARQEGRA